MFFRKREKLDWGRVRELVPERAPHAEWTPRDTGSAGTGEMRVTVKRSATGMASLLSRFFTMPLTRTIVLDSVGARVWELCDGATPVHKIASELVRLNGWPRDKTEEAILHFLLMLSSRQMVGFKQPDSSHTSI